MYQSKANFSGAKKGVFTFVLLLAGACLSFTACTDSKLAGGSLAGGDGAVLTVQGSDTMDKMVRAWSQAFIKEHPQVKIQVQSGDTGSGIKYLIEHKINVAAASREITDDESGQAHSKGVHLSKTMVAKDAVALIVGPNNLVTTLTMDELKGIFSGDVTKWSQLKSRPAGQVDGPIIVLGREASSGTGDYLREHVLAGKPYGANVKLMPSSQAVIDAVEKQKEAIGFVGMPQAENAGAKVKVVNIRLNSASPTEDKEDKLTGSDYPLSRPLYLYSDATGSALSKSFVAFCKSEGGQKIARDMGFMTIH